MPDENNASVKITSNATPANQSELEGSMSYAMVTIGSGAGHLAAGIFSFLARGLRILSLQARGNERRSRTSYARQGLAGSQWKSRGA